MLTKKFDTNHTAMLKGIGIVLMLMHHLFYGIDSMATNSVKTIFFNAEQIANFSIHVGKVCVAIFVFSTVYGISCKLRSSSYEKRALRDISIFQYLKLIIMFQFTFGLCFLFCIISKYNDPVLLYSGEAKNSVFQWTINFIIDMFGLANYFHTPTLSSVWWYMSLAISLVFFTPLIWRLYKEIGGILVPLSYLLPKFCGLFEIVGSDGTYGELNSFAWYLPTIVLAIFASENDLFIRLSNLIISKNNIVNYVIKIIFSTLFLCLIISIRIKRGYVAINDSLITLCLGYLVYDFMDKILIVKVTLKILGNYSAHMYLVHALIIGYLRDYIYSFEYDIVILLVLVIISLLVSICISLLKKLFHVSSLANYIYENISRRLPI